MRTRYITIKTHQSRRLIQCNVASANVNDHSNTKSRTTKIRTVSSEVDTNAYTVCIATYDAYG